MDQKNKIRKLFYNDKEENRNLAFELAKGANCYEEIVEEFYAACAEIPDFEMERQYLIEDLEADGLVVPEGIELKRLLIDSFTSYFFHFEIDLNRKWKPSDDSSKLKHFPKILLQLDFVKKLNLSWNDLDVIPEEICQMKSLEDLNLACNSRLRGLPDGLAELTELRRLSVYGISGIFSKRKFVDENPNLDDYTNEFSPCIRQLKKLQHLDVADVIIDRIPAWINELTELEGLYIFSGFGSHPYLELPSSLTDLPKLKTLQINAYTIDIPEDIDKMQSLEYLIIEPALHIPASIKNLKNLEYLDLSYFSHSYPIYYENYDQLWDLYDKGVPEGVSRIELYRWEWLKEMTWLKEFVFKHIEPYAFTDVEEAELRAALPNCEFVLKES